MHGSKIDVLLELIQPLVESQLCVVFCPSWQAEIGPECVKTPSRTLAMISEDFIAGIAHEALYPR